MLGHTIAPFWKRFRLTLVLMALAAAAVVFWWHRQSLADDAPSAPRQQGDAGRSGGQSAWGPGRFAEVDLAQPALLSDGRPSDFSPEEWEALKAAMAQTSNPQAELQRVTTYLRFQRQFEQWQALRDDPRVALRRQLASALVAQVPDRLRQGEVSAAEAQVLGFALWSDIEPDDTRRKVRLEELRAALDAAAPQPDGERQAREAAQLAEYKRRESALLQEYQARPEAQRDPVWLEAQLEAARKAVYARN